MVTHPRAPREAVATELVASLILLTAIVLFALAGLALAANWPKLIRVGLAFLTYVAVLIGSLKGSARLDTPANRLPFWAFAAAGASAGLVSGLVRPTVDWPLVVVSTLGAALLLGGFHWLAVRSWRRVFGRIVRSSSQARSHPDRTAAGESLRAEKGGR